MMTCNQALRMDKQTAYNKALTIGGVRIRSQEMMQTTESASSVQAVVLVSKPISKRWHKKAWLGVFVRVQLVK